MARTETKTTRHSETFHLSNPNPQNIDNPLKGARKGYADFYKSASPNQEFLRFGKKVDYLQGDRKMNSKELMETHLKQIRQKMDSTRHKYIVKRQQEKEFLDQLAELEKLETDRR